MKMKKWIIALVALIAVNCFANRIDWMNKSVEENLADLNGSMGTRGAEGEESPSELGLLWVGINENAKIGNDGMIVSSWLTDLADPDSASFRIRINNETIPDAVDGITENWVGNPGSGYLYPMWAQFSIPNIDQNTMVYYDLGISTYDEVSDTWTWDITVGTASASISQLIADNHVYGRWSLSPPAETEWKPSYYAVPEPSTAILALLGTCLLLRRRKSVCA